MTLGDPPAAWGPEFLDWFRRETEAAWEGYEPHDYGDPGAPGGLDWQPGTRWRGGLTEARIQHAERRFKVRFSPPHRLFLSTLHTADRPMLGFLFTKEGPKAPASRQEPYDWSGDAAPIEEALAWPLQGTLFDVEHNVLWLEEWGKRPAGAEARAETVRAALAKAPPLVPLYGHRYAPSDPVKGAVPVLSVYQTDIIVYGSDFRHYLLTEFAELLGLDRDAVDRAGFTKDGPRVADLPVWGRLAASRD